MKLFLLAHFFCLWRSIHSQKAIFYGIFTVIVRIVAWIYTFFDLTRFEWCMTQKLYNSTIKSRQSYRRRKNTWYFAQLSWKIAVFIWNGCMVLCVSVARTYNSRGKFRERERKRANETNAFDTDCRTFSMNVMLMYVTSLLNHHNQCECIENNRRWNKKQFAIITENSAIKHWYIHAHIESHSNEQ